MSDWLLPPDFPTDLTGWEGFVYEITNNLTGRKYLGKKNFWAKRGKKLIPMKWQSYWGSNTDLLLDIKQHGEGSFARQVLSWHRTAYLLNYEEVAAQIRADVLRATLADGSPAFYNSNVNGKWYARTMREQSLKIIRRITAR